MNFGNLIDASYGLVNGTLLPLAFTLCLLYFFWGVAQYIRNDAGDEKKAKEGRGVMVWGVVALFVVFSIWGIVQLLQREFQIRPIQNINIQGR